MKRITRRDLMKRSIAAGAALALAGPFSRVRGANDDIRVAVVGFRGHGKTHINAYLKMPGVRVVALCDADSDVLARGVAQFKARNEKVDAYTDIRRLLEDKSIDAVSTATPNHWHALATVWSCQAGKDVCVEKPVSHNIFEGRKMVEAARKYNRIVQADLDLRSDDGLAEAIRYIQRGELGKIVVVRGFCYKRRKSMGRVDGPQKVPESVDYNLWCGPAPMGSLMRKNLHYDWHWVWATGCGEIGNNGPHQLDVCRWVLGLAGLPKRVVSIGGRFGYDDDGETPNTQIAIYDCEPAPIIYEVRSRKISDIRTDILEGHLSTALCHMGNISYRIGAESSSEQIKEVIKGDKDSLEALERFGEHQSANGVSLNKTPAVLGPWLKMDSSEERFFGRFSNRANELLTRDYRKPFVVPDQV